MKKGNTPISIIMDKAKKEIGSHVISVMEANNIPAGVMLYILDSIRGDVSISWQNTLTDAYIDLQKEGAKHGDIEQERIEQ